MFLAINDSENLIFSIGFQIAAPDNSPTDRIARLDVQLLIRYKLL